MTAIEIEKLPSKGVQIKYTLKKEKRYRLEDTLKNFPNKITEVYPCQAICTVQ